MAWLVTSVFRPPRLFWGGSLPPLGGLLLALGVIVGRRLDLDDIGAVDMGEEERRRDLNEAALPALVADFLSKQSPSSMAMATLAASSQPRCRQWRTLVTWMTRGDLVACRGPLSCGDRGRSCGG